MRRYKVFLDNEAEDDLLDIYRYVAANDSIRQADRVLAALTQACQKLRTVPLRGHIPPELERIGVPDFREVRYKPYRIFYSVQKRTVFIHCILDGRRDLQTLLQERLIR